MNKRLAQLALFLRLGASFVGAASVMFRVAQARLYTKKSIEPAPRNIMATMKPAPAARCHPSRSIGTKKWSDAGYQTVTSARYSLVAIRRNDTSATPMSDLFRG